MAFKAKYTSTCTLCSKSIYPGDYKTWNRATKGDMHLDCWRETDQYKDWKAKQDHRANDFQGDTSKQEAMTEAKTVELSTKQEIKEKDETMTKEGDNVALDVLGQAIWQRIEPKVSKLDGFEDKFTSFKQDVVKTISTEIEKAKADLPKPTVVHIKEEASGEVKDLGIQHKLLPLLIKMMGARDHEGHRLNLWLVGPAGTGKSRASETAAKALGLRYACTGSIIDTYKLTGHFSPGTGSYVSTMFRDFWENGGVFCFDDFDGSDPNAVTEMLPLSNGVFPFPDAMIPRHKDFCLILTANTWGLGGTTDYVGRVKQDAAFINRFVQFHWNIDEDLELTTCPNQAWAKYVQKIRAKVKAKGLKVMITPRQSYQGAALLTQGIEQDKVKTIVLRGSMTQEQWDEVS